MTLTHMHHITFTIPKGKEDEGRAFYCGVLGLQEIEKPESLKTFPSFKYYRFHRAKAALSVWTVGFNPMSLQRYFSGKA